MLGFAPLSSVALGSLPSGAGKSVTSLGPTASFGTPVAAYNQAQDASGFAPAAFGAPTFGTTVQADTVGQNTRFGAPPLFGLTVAQVIGNGADGETTFADVSPYYATTTRNGSIAKSTTQSRYGAGSIRLTGASTANNVSLSAAGGTRLNLTGKQFTIEAQVYLNAYNASGGRLLGSGSGANGWLTTNGFHWALSSTATGVTFEWLWYGYTGVYWSWNAEALSAAVSLATWQQIKVTFDGTTVRLFVEGALIASSTRPISIYGTTTVAPTLSIGALPGEPTGATFAADAYLQQIRVRLECTNTAAFTVPTEGLPSWIGETPSKAISTQIPTPRGIRVQPVSGFAPVQFGTGFGQNLQRPTGFTTTQFGDHRLFPYHPVPFKSTQFGTGRLFPFHVAPGFRPNFGAVLGQQYWRAPSLGPVPRFGTPTTPTDRSAVASPTVRVGFGWPISMATAPGDLTRRVYAYGSRQTHFGSPLATWQQFGAATSIVVGWLGHPRTVIAQTAAGFASGAFGVPANTLRQRASGFRQTVVPVPSSGRAMTSAGMYLTRVGTPRAANVQGAAGFSTVAVGTPSTRIGARPTPLRPVQFGLAVASMALQASASTKLPVFGVPAGSDPNARRAYGVHSIRFGRPGGFSRFNYGAIGFACPHFGNAGCYETHRVRHASTNTAFGKPQLSRSTQC